VSRLIRGFLAWLSGLVNHNPPGSKPSEWLIEYKDSPITSLSPELTSLVKKYRLRRAALISRLVSAKHENLNDVYLLQSGAVWLGYLESEILGPTKVKVVAAPDEVDEFEKVRSFIESVGTPQGQ